MIRGAARGMWRSPRQLLRASKRKGSSDSKRTVCDLTKQESAASGSGGQHKHAFGRTTTDVIPRAMAIGVFDALNVGAIDALMLSLKDVAEDDDGR